MSRGYRFSHLLALLLIAAVAVVTSGCGEPREPLTLYAGKGLKVAVDEVVANFQRREGVKVNVIYAGSHTLLNVINTTHRGDVFIPGSSYYVEQAGVMVADSRYVARHVPTFAVSPLSDKPLSVYADLLQPGVRIAVANEQMAAIGRVATAIIANTPEGEQFSNNIVITASTVNELMQLLKEGRVDAAMIWTDMLYWEGGEVMKRIDIPEAINQAKEIRVATLSTTELPIEAKLLTAYIANEGSEIFIKHGFGR